MSASLSIVIPAYNEAVRLGNTLVAVVNYLRESWPDPVLHQRLYKSYTEVCIAYATLLGADIKCGTDESPGWTVNAWYCPVQGGQKLFGDDALDVAEQFLCRKCRWVALNKETNEWELVML